MTAAQTEATKPETYHLADVEKRAAQHPSFQIPTAQDRRSIPVGHFAKLVFCDIADGARQPAAERMWVKVTAAVDAGGRQIYLGELDNDPHFIEGLRRGDAVSFEPRHVAGLQDPADW